MNSKTYYYKTLYLGLLIKSINKFERKNYLQILKKKDIFALGFFLPTSSELKTNVVLF